LLPEEFLEFTMREFRLKQKGYYEELRDEQIHDWNLVRTLGSIMMKPHLKKGKNISPEEILSLPIDKKKSNKNDIEKRRKRGILVAKKLAKIEEKNKNKEKKTIGMEELFVKKS